MLLKPSDKIKVFVSDTSPDVAQEHQLLRRVLKKAGMEVLEQKQSADRLIEQAHCSVHLLGRTYDGSNGNDKRSVSEEQFLLAQTRQKPEDEFKIFVWQPWQENSLSDSKQNHFINRVQQSILQNMVFSKQVSPVMFVEDMRSMLVTENQSKQATNETDIFFIYNELDEETGKSIAELLGDVAKVESLTLSMDSSINYSELIVQQMQQSKLAVVYFEKTSDWALPFVQQVWRKIGGASSEVEILFIGNANIQANQNISFDAPKVHSMVIAHELIPLEIKVQLDKLQAKK